MCNIFILDDDPDTVEVIEMILIRNGFKVNSFFQPDTLLEAIDMNMPHVILLDVRIGDKDGREVCQQIKNNWGNKIKVILSSAELKLKQSAMDYMADDFLEKPFDLHDLVNKVKQYCDK